MNSNELIKIQKQKITYQCNAILRALNKLEEINNTINHLDEITFNELLVFYDTKMVNMEFSSRKKNTNVMIVVKSLLRDQ